MRINKIEFKNFGPYKGTFELEFKKLPNKNIEIITGRNGTGKTHVFTAIQWCLYGYEPSPKDTKPKIPTNIDSWAHIYGTHKQDNPPPDPYMSVTLWLEDENNGEINRYIIQRLTKPKKDATSVLTSHNQIETVLTLYENGKENYSPREKIDSLLPVSASQFFMFHGEDLRPMSQKHLDQTKKAIELILEAELFRQGLEDLKKINRDIEKEINEELAKVEGLEGLIKSKNAKIAEREAKEKDLEETKINLETEKTLLIEVEDKLKSFESSRVIMGLLDKNKAIKEQINDDIKKLSTRRDSLINQLPSFYLLPTLKDILNNKQEIYDKNTKYQSELSEINGKLKMIEEISTLSKCLCGNEITDVEKTFIEEEKMSLLVSKEEIKNKIIEVDPSYYDIRELVVRIESRDLDFEQYRKDLNELQLRLDEVQQTIDNSEKQLKGIDREEIAKLTVNRNNHFRKIGECEERIKNIERSLETVKKAIDNFDRLIKQREKSYFISNSLDGQYNLSKNCYDAYKYIMDKLIELRKQQLGEETSNYFTKLTNNPEEYVGINIDDGYNVMVIDAKGDTRKRKSLSTGERGVVALSFILGLKMASEKNAPLVLDTFFSHLDESHYSNIVQALPGFADQIILILTDLEYKSLKERVSESFFESVNNVWSTKRIPDEERSEIFKMEVI